MQSLPSATYEELDESSVPPASLVDYHGLITPTLFGPADKPYLITTVDGFKSTFGANGAGSPFFAQIKRALARGTALYIQRLLGTTPALATIELDTSQVSFTAKWMGAYANNTIGIQYTPKGAGQTCSVKIVYTPFGSGNATVTETYTAAAFTDLPAIVNAQSTLVTMTAAVGATEPESSVGAPVYLTAGSDGTFTDDEARATAVNGLLPNFNDILGLSDIGAMGAYTPGDAANLLAYAAARGDLVALFELDPSLSIANAQAAAQALDIPAGSSFIACYWGSYLNAWSPEDQATVAGPILPDVMSVVSYSDTIAGNSYKAPAGGTRGVIPNVQSFAFNLLSPARVDDANILVQAGINIVGQHPTFGPVVWGAQTMNQKNSSLDALNVRRSMLSLRAQLQPIFDGELFDPQDPSTWRDAYKKSKSILNAMTAAGAFDSWTYTGDQNASTVAGAVYNKPTDLANGLYKALIQVVPTGYIASISFIAEVNSLLSLFQSQESA